MCEISFSNPRLFVRPSLYRSEWYAVPRHAGFTDVSVTLRPAPATFARPEELQGYIETVVLGRHAAAKTPEEREDLSRQVAERLPGGVVDYVRLEVTARRR